MADYGDHSIDSLDGAERVRRRPAAILGSDGVAGARHGVTEIIGNAVDEATSGFGNKLDIVYYTDGGVSVRDYGRGVPMGYNENKKIMNWFLVFNEMYAGGKYKDYQDELRKIKDWSKFDPKDYNYLFSIGLNGLGAASTQYTSEKFYVESYRDGKVTKMRFEHGYPVLELEDGDLVANPSNLEEYLKENPDFNLKLYKPKIEDTDEVNGTYIKWKPDAEVFSDVDLTFEWIKDKCKAIAYVSGLSVNLLNESTNEPTFYEKGTISDLVVRENKNNLVNKESPTIYHTTSLTHGNAKDLVYVCQAELSLVRTEKAGKVLCFHNGVKMKGGAQYDGIMEALWDFFYTIGTEKGLKIVDSDYRGKFGIIVNSYSNIASYKGQTKEEVDNTFIASNVRGMLYDLIRIEYHKGNGDIKELINEVIEEAELRIAIQQQAKALREVSKATKTRKLPEKFVPSTNFSNHQFDNSELWIVEGESAKGSVKKARDSVFQAIYAVRGKMKNALKASLESILKTVEIRDIFTLARTGMQIEGLDDEESFDLSRSRFSKYVIATDADEDGYQIRVLIFCAFWKLAPQIIENGMLYIAQSPKFCLTLNDGSRVYAVKDEERDELMKEYAGRVSRVERYKGLGQVNYDVLKETTMDPETRRMIQIKLNPADYDLNTVIETVFGKDPYSKRKETLLRLLGSDAIEMFDDNSELFNLIENSEYEDDDIEELEVL